MMCNTGKSKTLLVDHGNRWHVARVELLPWRNLNMFERHSDEMGP